MLLTSEETGQLRHFYQGPALDYRTGPPHVMCFGGASGGAPAVGGHIAPKK